jgi:hypothetical protein
MDALAPSPAEFLRVQGARYGINVPPEAMKRLNDQSSAITTPQRYLVAMASQGQSALGSFSRWAMDAATGAQPVSAAEWPRFGARSAAPGQFTISMRARDGGGGWDGGAPFMDRSVAAVGPINIDNLQRAIVGKESGGSFSVVNSYSGALGYGQVMPANVPSWTKEHYGRSLTPRQFLNNKEAQLAVVNGQISKIVRQQLAAGHKGDVAIRRAAAIWYSGQGDLYDDRRPQSTNGQSYPSIRDYTLDILRRYSKGG